MTTEPDMSDRLDPRAVVSFSDAEINDLCRRGGLTDDPLDPRIGLVIAREAFWEWTAQASSAAGPAAAAALVNSDQQRPSPVWETLDENAQRLCPAVDVCFESHRVVLCPVVRGPGCDQAIEHRVPFALLKALGVRGESFCPMYVELEAAGSGGANVLLEGFVSSAELGEHSTDDAASFVSIDPGKLRGMGELWEQLRKPAPAPHPAAEPMAMPAAERVARHVPKAAWTPRLARKGWPMTAKLVTAGSLLAAAAAVVAIVTVLNQPAIVAPHPGGALATTVAEWQIQTQAIRGPQDVVPTLLSGQPYNVSVRAASDRKRAWLFQIDAKGAYPLGELKRADDGSLSTQFKGTLDERTGWEFFAVILSDAPWDGLSPGGDNTASWLSGEQAATLQTLADQGQDRQIGQELQAAAERSAPAGQTVDVKFIRFEHR